MHVPSERSKVLGISATETPIEVSICPGCPGRILVLFATSKSAGSQDNFKLSPMATRAAPLRSGTKLGLTGMACINSTPLVKLSTLTRSLPICFVMSARSGIVVMTRICCA